VIFASPNIKKQANLWLPLNVLKLDVFRLEGGFALLTPLPRSLSFAYCSVTTVSLFNTNYDICAIGLLFHLCQGNCHSVTGKVREFCYRKPVGTLFVVVTAVCCSYGGLCV